MPAEIRPVVDHGTEVAVDFQRRAACLPEQLPRAYGPLPFRTSAPLSPSWIVGETHAALHQPAEARRAWHTAVELFRTQHRRTEAERVQRQLLGLSQMDLREETN